jgi:acyl transferase domain-containing protein/NAD(P)-dependent dehydrogenase (short-subunit alcohol dehydrogenase family)/acyl carrier protein
MVGIAIIGMACRFPGGIDTIDGLWSALENRVNTASEVPNERWNSDYYHAEDERAPAKAYVRRANFLAQDVRTMDAAFFDLPPRVAENLDPQQRLMLEVVWEAFENAGLSLPAHAKENVGVYVGGFMLDHMITLMDTTNRTLINANTAAGMMMTMLSNRISHAFDLRGPSLSIDTACSSSLTAFNYGCQDIWRGACDVAMVGGVNIMTRHQYPVGMSKGQFLARDGECKSFDERGDGYGRGEGAGAVLLKRLDKAIQDGDPILATVLATGVNSDGKTPGISMPSGDAQRQLIEDVCRDYDVDPKTVNYVECHGTGTAVGDPTEAGSIGSVFGAGRDADDRVVIGSIKSNIGHTEAAAGIAGIIKAVLTLQKRKAAPLANLKTPNPNIPFDELGIRLSDDMISLGEDGQPLRAAVNSFGYGGTNAHAILETPPETALEETAQSSRPDPDFPRMLPISARSDKAVAALAGRYADQIAKGADSLDDILHSASFHRAHLSHRAVVLGEDAGALVEGLRKLADGERDDRVATGQAPFAGKEQAVFVYTGMGPQWWSMGQELYRENRRFKETLDEADAMFKEISGFSILDEMLKDEEASEITKTEFAQPANFMIQLGLTELLKDAGVEPGAIVGHSVGEVTSAYAAGALTLKEALTVSYHRSRTQAKTAGTGSMLAVGLSEQKLRPYLEGMEDRIDLAAVNGPGTLTLSGDTLCIHRLMEALTEADVFNRELRVEVPYHSYLMDPITDELITSLEGVQPAVPSKLLYSTVTGEPVDDIAYDGPYWAANVREPVAFMKAINGLLDEGFTTFVQIGPHPVLSSALRECARAKGKDVRMVETLRRGDSETPRMQKAIAQVFADGGDIDWMRHNPDGRFVPLPNYAWQRDLHWLETERSVAERNGMAPRPFLGIRDSSAAQIWRNDVDYNAASFLADHVVTGVPVMPAAGYLETLFELGEEVLEEGVGVELRDVTISSPLTITPGRGAEIVTSYDSAIRRATIKSAETGSVGQGQLHMAANILPMASAFAERHDLGELGRSFGPKVDVQAFYSGLADLGLQYGPAFQAVKELRFNLETREALAKLEIAPEHRSLVDKFRVHPSLQDGCFQILMGILPDKSTLYLPTGFRSIRIMPGRSPETIWCHGRFVNQTAKTIECDLTLMDETGQVYGVVRGMQATAGAGGNQKRTDKWGDEVRLRILNYDWKTASALAEPKRFGHWLVFCDSKLEVGAQVANRLDALGAMPKRLVSIGETYSSDGHSVTIRPGDLNDARRVIEEAGPLDGVFFAHGLDSGDDSGDPTGEQAIETMTVALQVLAERDIQARPRIYVATQLAFSTDHGATAAKPAQTAINGFTRVAHNELEGMKASSIDLPSRLDDAIIEALGLELLCDAEEDEIALRGRRRLMSVVAETDVLSAPSAVERRITDDAPVLIRATENPSAEGMVDLLDMPAVALGQGDLKLRVEAMSLPSKLLLEPGSNTLDQPFVALIGSVVSVGDAVDDLQAGMRVFGFAPAEIATCLTGPRAAFHLAPLSADVDAEAALGALSREVLAEYAATVSDFDKGDAALVLGSDPQAVAVGEALSRRGIRVTSIGTDEHPLTPEGVYAAAQVLTGGNKFDAIVAPIADWHARLDFEGLRQGGTLIDCGAHAALMALPSRASQIVRTDLSVATGRPRRLQAALATTAERLEQGEVVASSNPMNLGIRLSSLVRQQLETPPPDLAVNLMMDMESEAFPVITDNKFSFDHDATYLITGGLGGFGQKTARWMVELGARHLVLASRSGANSPDKEAFVASLAELGVSVQTPKVDLADRDAVFAMVEQVKEEMPPLKGVFHSAAVFEDMGIVDLELGAFRRVMGAKASSALALDEATSDLPLDYFVLYSSIANSVGNSRQPAYAAANGYLDGLAWRRQAEGKPATSINWGAIADAGVVQENEETEQFLRYIGIRGLSSAEALDHLENALKREITQVGVMLMTNWTDWARYETIGSQSLRFAGVIAEDLEAGGGGNSEVRDQLIADLAEIPDAERLDVLAGLIAQIIANELRSDPSSISIDRPINELGVDSLMATEIQLLLEKDLGIKIAVMDMLGDASVRSIADRSLAEFGFVELKAAE